MRFLYTATHTEKQEIQPCLLSPLPQVFLKEDSRGLRKPSTSCITHRSYHVLLFLLGSHTISCEQLSSGLHPPLKPQTDSMENNSLFLLSRDQLGRFIPSVPPSPPPLPPPHSLPHHHHPLSSLLNLAFNHKSSLLAELWS